MSPSFLETRLGTLDLHLSRAGARATRRWLGRERVVLDEAASETGNAGVLRAAAAVLARPELQGAGRRLRVGLSAGLVRYILLPWSEQRLRPVQREAIAAALFAERHGQPAGGYALVLEAERYRQATLAAGIERAWLDQLRELVEQRGFHLASLTPLPSQHINRMLRQVKSPSGWLALADDGQLLSLAFARRQWLQIHSERLPAGGLAASLEASLRRDAVRHAELLQGRVFLAGGEQAGTRAANRLADLWDIVHLPATI